MTQVDETGRLSRMEQYLAGQKPENMAAAAQSVPEKPSASQALGIYSSIDCLDHNQGHFTVVAFINNQIAASG